MGRLLRRWSGAPGGGWLAGKGTFALVPYPPEGSVCQSGDQQ